MLLLRPTRKVLNIARITQLETDAEYPHGGILNDWHVDIAGLGLPGKTALLFVHTTTYVTVIVPGKSLKKAMPEFLMRLESLLLRHHVSVQKTGQIMNGLSPVVFCKTNDRKTLGIMNERKYELFALFQVRFDITRFSNWDLIEDEMMDYLNKPREGKGYSRPVEELRKMLI